MNSIKKMTSGLSGTSIAVIGDLCLDIYYILDDRKSEISVETGIRTQPVSGLKFEAGGAGNVAINLKVLGAANIDIYGIIGNDYHGTILRDILNNSEVGCKYIQTQESEWNTHVYHKVYENKNEKPRYDIGNFNKADTEASKSLLKNLQNNISNYQTVIINEQITDGYHTEFFQKNLVRLIEKYEDKCFWISDCRHLNHIYNGSIRKLNIHEAQNLFKKVHKNTKVVPSKEKLVKWLHQYWKKSVIITLGEDGAIAADHDGSIKTVPGINIVSQTDPVGAGDAFLSAAALAITTGETLQEALNLGNLSAAVSVTRLRETGHPSIGDILKMGESPDYRYNPELAKDSRKARFIRDSSVELINLKKTGLPKVVIFDHDGTISTLRQGWEPIMRATAIEAVLGNCKESALPQEILRIEKAVEEMIEKTTGIQTIIQMHHLQNMVRSFGFVPESKIQSPVEYKNRYNEKLLKMVSTRIELFERDLLNLDDVTMKGAIQFLEILREKGISIYLASGTDQNDVGQEAAILGYDDYFDGGIFGSVGNVNDDPKKMVIETIINSLPDNIKPEECYVFGDGPVEMREAAKRGFTRIGLVSDEKQRFGINPEKRSRLILGGAQALIPDFSWIPALSEYLGWRM